MKASLEKRVSNIEERNKKVEANKAWETSITRKLSLMIITYFVIALTLTTIHNDRPWINALIPAVGFFLSTLTLPYIRRHWEKFIYHN